MRPVDAILAAASSSGWCTFRPELTDERLLYRLENEVVGDISPKRGQAGAVLRFAGETEYVFCGLENVQRRSKWVIFTWKEQQGKVLWGQHEASLLLSSHPSSPVLRWQVNSKTLCMERSSLYRTEYAIKEGASEVVKYFALSMGPQNVLSLAWAGRWGGGHPLTGAYGVDVRVSALCDASSLMWRVAVALVTHACLLNVVMNEYDLGSGG